MIADASWPLIPGAGAPAAGAAGAANARRSIAARESPPMLRRLAGGADPLPLPMKFGLRALFLVL